MHLTVFGANGGIGSRMVDRLITAGHPDTGVVCDPTKPDELAAKLGVRRRVQVSSMMADRQ